jgi:hypothetical protein
VAYHLASDVEVMKRRSECERLLRAICEPDDFPWFVSDEATVFEVCMVEEAEILTRLTNSYGAAISAADLALPIWQLAERLDASARGEG